MHFRMNQSMSEYDKKLEEFCKRRIFEITKQDIETILAGNGYIVKSFPEFLKRAMEMIKNTTGRDIKFNAVNPGWSYTDRKLIATAIVLTAIELNLPRKRKPVEIKPVEPVKSKIAAPSLDLTDEERCNNAITVTEKLIERKAVVVEGNTYIVLFTNDVHSAMRAVHTVGHDGNVIQQFERWLGINSIGRDRKPEDAAIIYRKLILDIIEFTGYAVDRESNSYIFCDYADLLNMFMKAADAFN